MKLHEGGRGEVNRQVESDVRVGRTGIGGPSGEAVGALWILSGGGIVNKIKFMRAPGSLIHVWSRQTLQFTMVAESLHNISLALGCWCGVG